MTGGFHGPVAIAVVELACRLPGAASPRELLELFRYGTEAVRQAPEQATSMLWFGCCAPNWSGMTRPWSRLCWRSSTSWPIG